MAADPDGIAAQYGTGDFVARVGAVLTEAGLGDGLLAWDTLAPLDQFHVGGAAATGALAERLGLTAEMRVVDVGCGLGGPSRHLAASFGCSVEGIDLNPALVELAVMLTRRCGLADRVRHQVANATRLPFEDAVFDAAWTQHVAMNIADRAALYAEIFRVLRPGGLFALYDVVAGEGGALHFPVPWARDQSASFLLSPDATRQVLEASGFAIVAWTDATEQGRAWFQGQTQAAQSRPEPLRPLALPLIMGPDFPLRTVNLGRNFVEDRARLLQAILRRPMSPTTR